MTDLACFWNDTHGDFLVTDGDIVTDDGLKSEVLRALFSDARAASSDILPAGQTNRRGWWGNMFSDDPEDNYGSKLWLLSREKQTEQTRVRANQIIVDALDYLKRKGLTDRIDVVTEWIGQGRLGIAVVIWRPKADVAEYRYNFTWDAEDALFAAASAERGIVDHITPQVDLLVTDSGDTLVTDSGDPIVFGE